MLLGKAKPRSYEFETYFSVSSLPQCWSQAFVCVSTPRMYLRSGYFLVFPKLGLEKINYDDTRKYLLCRYILGVLTHTNVWEQHWKGDEILK